MANKIDIRDLYLSIVKSLDSANQQVEEADKEAKRAYSYAITDLEFSIPFNELNIDEAGKVDISLAGENEQVNSAQNLKFKVRFVPRVQTEEEEEPPKEEVIVPDLLGKEYAAAVSLLEGVGLNVGKVTYNARYKPEGIVRGQSPDPKTKILVGEKVDLIVSGKAPNTGTKVTKPSSLVTPKKASISKVKTSQTKIDKGK